MWIERGRQADKARHACSHADYQSYMNMRVFVYTNANTPLHGVGPHLKTPMSHVLPHSITEDDRVYHLDLGFLETQDKIEAEGERKTREYDSGRDRNRKRKRAGTREREGGERDRGQVEKQERKGKSGGERDKQQLQHQSMSAHLDNLPKSCNSLEALHPVLPIPLIRSPALPFAETPPVLSKLVLPFHKWPIRPTHTM